MGDNLAAIPLGGEPVDAIATSGHACAVLTNGSLKCWGNNGWGQLAVGGGSGLPASPTDVQRATCAAGTGPNATALCIGDAAGEVAGAYACRWARGRTVKQLAGGDRQTCVMLDNNDIKCWGFNGVRPAGPGHHRQLRR